MSLAPPENQPTAPHAASAAERSAFYLDVGDGHRLWVQTLGNATGVPMLFLHGGPGSGCNPGQQGLFDPARHFAVFLDQRGAGKSLPPRSRAANTTQHLIADIERLRQHLGLERWLIVGGSWGATLGLAYAEQYPERVSGLALRAVFLGTRAELEAAFCRRLKDFHPDLHLALAAHLPALPPEARLPALWQLILSEEPAVHVPAAHLWYDIERALSSLAPMAPPGLPRVLPATPFMEAHYFSHDCFLADGALLANAKRLHGIPGILIQGRFDLLCPPATTAALAAVWPDAAVRMVEGAGHGLSEPGIFEALREAIDTLSRQIG